MLKNITLNLKTPYNIAKKQLENNSTSFTFEPLAPGLGHTIGSALRRTMLMNTVSSSLVAIQIPGIEHEFSSITGINIDMPELLVKLKTLSIKGVFNGLATSTINVPENATDIYVKDIISISGDIEFNNLDTYLFTSTGIKAFDINMWFACGYNTTCLNNDIKNMIDKLNINVIRCTDYYFRSVISVSCKVKEIMYSGECMDSLEIVVHTNGAVNTENALYNALHNINLVFNSIEELSPLRSISKTENKQRLIQIDDKNQNIGLDQSLLPFIKNIEVQNFLESENILTVNNLLLKVRTDIQYLINHIPGGLVTLKNIATQIKNIDATIDVSTIEDLLG